MRVNGERPADDEPEPERIKWSEFQPGWDDDGRRVQTYDTLEACEARASADRFWLAVGLIVGVGLICAGAAWLVAWSRGFVVG